MIALSVEEVAGALDVPKEFVLKLVVSGKIAAREIEGEWCIEREAFQRRFCSPCTQFPTFCVRCPWKTIGLADPAVRRVS